MVLSEMDLSQQMALSEMVSFWRGPFPSYPGDGSRRWIFPTDGSFEMVLLRGFIPKLSRRWFFGGFIPKFSRRWFIWRVLFQIVRDTILWVVLLEGFIPRNLSRDGSFGEGSFEGFIPRAIQEIVLEKDLIWFMMKMLNPLSRFANNVLIFVDAGEIKLPTILFTMRQKKS